MIRIDKNSLNNILLRLENTNDHYVFQFTKVETNEINKVYLNNTSSYSNYNLFQLNESITGTTTGATINSSIWLKAGEYYFDVYNVDSQTLDIEDKESIYKGYVDVIGEDIEIEVVSFLDGTENNIDEVIDFD